MNIKRLNRHEAQERFYQILDLLTCNFEPVYMHHLRSQLNALHKALKRTDRQVFTLVNDVCTQKEGDHEL